MSKSSTKRTPRSTSKRRRASPTDGPASGSTDTPAAPEATGNDKNDLSAEAIEAFQANTEEGRRLRKALHGLLAGDVYRRQILPLTREGGAGPILEATADTYGRELVASMKPRDALERMLVEQCLWTHGRVLHLSTLANQQTAVETSRQVNASADKASNTFRRLLLALAEYRRPPRSGDSFTAIKQANIANQQVVQNQTEKTQKPSNEQGFADAPYRHTDAGETKTLPPHTGGVSVAAPQCPSHEAVERGDRTTDSSG